MRPNLRRLGSSRVRAVIVPKVTRTAVTIAMLGLSALAAGGCSGEDESDDDAESSVPECAAIGDSCEPEGSDCCQGDGGPVQCLDGTCGVCLPLNAACSGAQCCDDAKCWGGSCCSLDYCAVTDDCCAGWLCGEQGRCCIPPTISTDFEPLCCMGSPIVSIDDGGFIVGWQCPFNLSAR